MNRQVTDIVNAIREKTQMVPKVALTLGSGLGGFAAHINVETEISYRDLPGFPVSTAPGHDGRFIFGTIGEGDHAVPVVCMKGRIHFYEGYDLSQVVLPARVMHALGAEILFLTNAAGGINENYHPGSLVMLTDHISSFVRNPLIGPNDDDEGVRFPDMSHVYDLELQELIRRTAEEDGIDLQEGIYAQFTGPSFETPAEIRMLKVLGADLVGMSTVVEAITARHMGMRVCCISLVTNMCAGLSDKLLSGDDVIETADAAAEYFTRLVRDAISRM